MPYPKSNPAGAGLGVRFVRDKIDGLFRLIESDSPGEWRIFTASESYAEFLGDLLAGHGYAAQSAGNGTLLVKGDSRAGRVFGVFFDLPGDARPVANACKASGDVSELCLFVNRDDLALLRNRIRIAGKRLNKNRLINLSKTEKVSYDIWGKDLLINLSRLEACVSGSGCRGRALGITDEDCGVCDMCRGESLRDREGFDAVEETTLAAFCGLRKSYSFDGLIRLLQGRSSADFVYPHYAALRGVPEERIETAIYRLKNAGLIDFENHGVGIAASGRLKHMLQEVS